MKKLVCCMAFAIAITGTANAQNPVIANYDFNSASAYPVALPVPTPVSGVNCSFSSTESFQTGTGIATSPSAYTPNSTAGNAVTMANSSGTNTRYFLIQLSGSNLVNYQNYKIYFQAQRNGTGANLITIAYSTNGSSYTNFPTTYAVGTSFSDIIVNLATITTLNNASAIYIKIMADGATSSSGSLAVDNLQIKATPGAGSPYQVSGNDITFNGNVGIGALNPDYALNVVNNANIGTNLNVGGDIKLAGDLNAKSITFGSGANAILLSTATMPNGAVISARSNIGAIQPPLNTCMPAYITGDHQQIHRLTVTSSVTRNMLDFTNDGSNGAIDYGFDIGMHAYDPNDPNQLPIPALKINGFCYGNVEIAKGGGIVSTGNNLEVGNPVRNAGIACNINASGSPVAQRVTKNSSYPEASPNPPAASNTQLVVNRSWIKALSVLNTVTNTNGDETFVVYGTGKTHIGTGRPLSGGLAETAMLSVDGMVLAKEVRVSVSTTTHWADYVFEKNYKLMPLKDLEHYIKTNKHLPEVPTTKDVEENGVDVSSISATLLKKIEELTLYTIELQKKIEVLEQQTKK